MCVLGHTAMVRHDPCTLCIGFSSYAASVRRCKLAVFELAVFNNGSPHRISLFLARRSAMELGYSTRAIVRNLPSLL